MIVCSPASATPRSRADRLSTNLDGGDVLGRIERGITVSDGLWECSTVSPTKEAHRNKTDISPGKDRGSYDKRQ